MRRLITLLTVLQISIFIGYAQDYLHVATADTVKEVALSQVDSITIRPAEFYGIDWAFMANAVYTYNDVIVSGSENVSVESRKCDMEGKKMQYRISPFQAVESLVIDCVDGICTVAPQQTGYLYQGQYYIYVTDAVTYGYTDYISTFDKEKGLFNLQLIYHCGVGYFPCANETIQLNNDSTATTRSATLAPLVVTPLEDLKPLMPLKRNESPLMDAYRKETK